MCIERGQSPIALHIFGRESLWRELEQAEAFFRPLSHTSYMLQRDENSVADVVASFGEMVYESQLVSILEKRWGGLEAASSRAYVFLRQRYGLTYSPKYKTVYYSISARSNSERVY